MAARGFDVHLFVADGNGDQTVAGVRVHDIGRRRGRAARFLVQPFRMFLAARKQGARVYHFHDPELLGIGLLLRLGGARVVYDAHEDLPRAILSRYWIRRILRPLISAISEVIESFAARRLSAIVTATPHIAQRFSRLNRTCVHVGNFPLRSEIDAPAVAGRGGRAVCYVGVISRIRGAFEMVRAMETLDARLILAGPFENAETERALRAEAGWRRVDYRGVVGRNEVRGIFGESLAGLVFFHPEPNHVDAQPNKLFEYMSAGLPVLGSNFPLWRDLFSDCGGGVCADPLDPEAIREVIRGVLDDPAGAREMGARGRHAVQTRYQWELEEPKLQALYDRLLSTNPSMMG